MTEAIQNEIHIQLPERRESREKALRSLANTGYLSVWEGSIRSGKTVLGLVAFALYVTQSEETTFLMSGRTLGTIERNCILGDYGLLNLLGLPTTAYRMHGQSKSIRFLSRTPSGKLVQKTVIALGSDTVKSYKALRGATLGGWFADEVNLHEQTFVEEALNRTAVSTDRKHFWTLNPDNPHHWIYKDYLDRYDQMPKADRKKLGGYHYWHFVPEDNPAMTPEMLYSLKLQYDPESYLYKRYILGLRCAAEGLVYPEITDRFFIDYTADDVAKTDIRYCAIDFGADHPTVMVFGGMHDKNRHDWRIVREVFDEKSGKTTFDYYLVYLQTCHDLGIDPRRVSIAIDPSALALRNEFIQHGLGVAKAKNDVLPGIAFVRNAVRKGILTFSKSMKHFRDEVRTYSWDSTASARGEDKVVKIHDDCADAVRYFAYTFMKPITGV